MTGAEIDRLGDRLRTGITASDLELLDRFRRGFRSSYELVIDRIRNEIGLETSGRPAKSTTAICDKLKRSSMRLTQMQDIAGCRIVVPSIAAQEHLAAALEQMFDAKTFDRRKVPSHGYRAMHLVTQNTELPVEIQIRTDLQHVWAELSEKLADAYGHELKYGGGSQLDVLVRQPLDNYSRLIADFEQQLDLGDDSDKRSTDLKLNIRAAMVAMTDAIGKLK